MSVIKTKNLTKKYGKFLAVNDLNIDVHKGKVYGFIGKNGAGKTTTINMLLSLLKPNSGEININGEVINYNNYDYKKKIGYVSDVPVFPNYMNAKEYLTYVGELFGMKGNELKIRVLEVLKFVGLENTKKLVKGYSRGMKQRLAIAASIVNDPEILIMDEPTSALDPIGRKQVLEIIDKLRGKKTVFYSTHILNDVERVCDVVCLIDNGNVVLEDTVENIKNSFYSNKYLVNSSNNDKLSKALTEQSWIKSVDNSKDGIIFEYTSKEKFNSEFLKLMVKSNINITELHPQATTLEDIFVKVVNNEDIN